MRTATDELPDYLPLMLELADMLGPGRARELLGEFRAAIELAAAALREQTSPYHHLLDALIALLGPATGEDLDQVMRLAARGPPSEEVGLVPFGPGPSASSLGQRRPGPESSGSPPELMPTAGAMP